MDDPTIEARQAGYSWDDIDEHIAGASEQAVNEGYTPEEIRSYLGGSDPAPFDNRVTQQWRHQLATDPALDVSDLAANPTMRSDYASALRQGQVSGPRDFADRYAAAMLGASGSSEVGGAAHAADDLEAQLPAKRDFTDAAIALGGDDVGKTRDNLIMAWSEDGVNVVDTSMRAQQDPELKAQLTEPPEKPLGQKQTWLEQFFEPVLDPLVGTVRGFLGAAQTYQRIENMMPDELQGAYQMAMKALSYTGLPLAHLDEFNADKVLKEFDKVREERGYDNWRVDFGQVLPAIPLFTTLGVSGLGGAIISGVTGGLSMAAFDPVTSENYWEEKAKDALFQSGAGGVLSAGLHGVIAGIGKIISHMTPEAAQTLGRMAPELVNPMVEELNLATADPIRHLRASEAFKDIEPAAMIAPKATAEGVLAPRPVVDPDANPQAQIAKLAEMHGEGKIKTRAVPGEEVSELYRQAVADGHIAANPATEKLALGHDAGNNFRGAISEMFTDLMRDESGAVHVPGLSTPQQLADAAAKKGAREYMRQVGKQAAGEATQYIAHLSKKIDTLRGEFRDAMPEWLQELHLGPAGTPGNTEIGKWLMHVDGGAVALAPDHPLTPLAGAVKDVLAQIHSRIAQQQAAGITNVGGFIKNYFPHMFKDSAAADEFFSGSAGKLGSRGNFMERQKFPTLLDAIASGQALKHEDPIDMLLAYINKTVHYSYAADMFHKMVEDNMAHWGIGSTVKGYKSIGDIAPGFGTKSFVMENPAFTKFPSDARKLGIAEKIPQDMQLWAHPELVKNLGYWLQQVHYSDNVADVMDKMLYMKNTLTGIKLAGPAFHAVTVTVASMASAFGQGMEELGRGQFLKAVGSIVGAPLQPLLAPRAGGRVIRDWVAMSGDRTIQELAKENARIGAGQPALESFTGRTPSVYHSFKTGTLARDMAQDVKNVFGPASDTNPYRAIRVPDRLAQMAITEAQRSLSAITAPLFDSYIPRLKAAAMYNRLDSFLKAYPIATEEAVAKYRRQVVQDVDNRFGEMQWDNLFWPKLAKQLMNIIPLSATWKYGTWRGVSSAVGYNLEKGLEWNPVALSSLFGTGITLTMGGAMLGYMLTGKSPDFSSIYTYAGGFNTGGQASGVAKGSPEKSFIPSEWKELMDVGTIVAKSYNNHWRAASATVEYAMGALAPLWKVAVGLATGHDSIGHDIYAMGARSVWKFLKDEGIEPIVTGQMAGRKAATGLPPIMSAMGFREAPKWAENWDAYQKAEKKREDKSLAAELKRARAENAQLETRLDLSDLPKSPIPAASPAGRPRADGGIRNADITPQRARSQQFVGGQVSSTGDTTTLRGGSRSGGEDSGGSTAQRADRQLRTRAQRAPRAQRSRRRRR